MLSQQYIIRREKQHKEMNGNGWRGGMGDEKKYETRKICEMSHETTCDMSLAK